MSLLEVQDKVSLVSEERTEERVSTSNCLFVDTNTLLSCDNASQILLNNFTDGIMNSSTNASLPPWLGFDDQARNDIIGYSVLFIIAAIGNLTVFISLIKSKSRKSRMKLMIGHLAVADLIVTFIMIPLEIGWRFTTQWMAGNTACKVLLFIRAFGLYLSSMILVCISLDRYFAICHPLKVQDATRRNKLMLFFAWCFAALCALPQSVIFHVAEHPEYPDFKQCVTFGFFRNQTDELTYNVFTLIAMYFMPLLLIIIVYIRILWEIILKARNSKDDSSSKAENGASKGRIHLRVSDNSNLERARARTLRMTLIIVIAFVWCWTPYVIIVMWYQFDRESAQQVNTRIQDALFIMAVSNSCVNPLVYGSHTINFKQEWNRCAARCFGRPVPTSRNQQRFQRINTGSAYHNSKHKISTSLSKTSNLSTMKPQVNYRVMKSSTRNYPLNTSYTTTSTVSDKDEMSTTFTSINDTRSTSRATSVASLKYDQFANSPEKQDIKEASQHGMKCNIINIEVGEVIQDMEMERSSSSNMPDVTIIENVGTFKTNEDISRMSHETSDNGKVEHSFDQKDFIYDSYSKSSIPIDQSRKSSDSLDSLDSINITVKNWYKNAVSNVKDTGEQECLTIQLTPLKKISNKV